MYIKELHLTGFKSFQEKTTLRFSAGMNAIIGPNGCGKTNILDALRWVLGEQSFSLLRCGKTEDLIFGGTASIPATNYADVRLVLANDGLPQYPGEVEIRRRFFRSGESEYYLNKQPCRQKDIQEVFLASGIGTKAYSIFDLRQMREIIAGNIRRMFEEAATLAKYQEAKADCERKLALTETDLTRLGDIIAERERVVRSLRRQLGKFRAWEKLKEEEKGYRLVELRADFDSVNQEHARLVKDVEMLEAAEAERSGEIGRLDEELHRQRGRLRQEQSLKDELADKARALRQRLTELEGRASVGRQKAQFLLENAGQAEKEKQELEAGSAELEALLNRALQAVAEANAAQESLERALEQAQEETRAADRRLFEQRSHEQTQREALASLSEQQHELRGRLAHDQAVEDNFAEAEARVGSELAELEQRLSRCRQESGELRNRVAEWAVKLDDERRRAAQLEAELAKVEQQRARRHEEFARCRDRRNRLEKELAVVDSARPDRGAQCAGVLGERLVGEVGGFLQIEKGWEKTCEAALQPLLDFLVSREEPDARTLDRLSESGLDSWCGLVALRNFEVRSSKFELSGSDVPQTEGVLGRLSDHVQVAANAPQVLRQMIGSFLVVKDGVEPAAAVKALPGWSLVSRRGWACFSDGRFVVAAGEQGRLRQSQVRTEKAQELESAAAQVGRLEQEERELERRQTELDRLHEEASETAAEAGHQKSLADSRLEALAAKEQELERDRQRLRADLDQTVSTREKNRQALESTEAELEGLAAKVHQQAGTLGRAEQQVREQEAAARAALEQAGSRLAALNEQRQQVSRLEVESVYARRHVEERRLRTAELGRGIGRAREEASQLEHEAAGLAPEVESLGKELENVEARIDALKVFDMASVEEELERNLVELRKAREQNQSILLDQRMREHELRQRRQVIENEAQQDYRTEIAGFEPAEVQDVVNRLAQVRQRLEALGKVNPLAREEYEQEKQDLERLAGQRSDVLAARENLVQTMAEIDRHARERFLETYEQVRTRFQEIFRQMFLDGDADLVLVDAARPLESEVAIIAKPRGKNPKRLEQLSDGEKALLAVSLLFAFYRVKPAPFCFLDEIDAPLDDANVGRFADYLKNLSQATQVIVITHNRLTVERAETLFGVTAEQPGISKLVSVSLADYQRSPAAVEVS